MARLWMERQKLVTFDISVHRKRSTCHFECIPHLTIQYDTSQVSHIIAFYMRVRGNVLAVYLFQVTIEASLDIYNHIPFYLRLNRMQALRVS